MALPQSDYELEMQRIIAEAQRLILQQAAPIIYHQAVLDTYEHLGPAISEGTKLGSSECGRALQEFKNLKE